mgnify:FL=1
MTTENTTDVVQLKLSNTYDVALVDAKYLPILSAFNWRVQQTGSYKQIMTAMPIGRFIMALASLIDKREVDHADRNPLNNTVANLRMVNKKIGKKNKSGYKGVCWRKDKQMWHAQMSTNNRTRHLGYFNRKEAAAVAYNKALRKRTDIREEFKVYNDV